MKYFCILYKIIFVFLIILLPSTTVFADDILPAEDNFDISEILEDIESIETASNSSEIPTINSRAYVVIDRNSNTVLVGKNENQKKKMASTTKIMTALVVIENNNLSDTVEISKKAASTGGSRLGLKTGDKLTVSDLLYGLMLRSGNDAAVHVAHHGRNPGDDAGKQDHGDTVAHTELVALLTQPHQEAGASHKGHDNDQGSPHAGVGQDVVAAHDPVVTEGLQKGDGHSGVAGNRLDLPLALLAAVTGHPLQSGDSHGQQLDNDGAVDIWLDTQGENRRHSEGAAAHHVV